MTQHGSQQTSPRPGASAPAASTPLRCRRTAPWPASPSTAGCPSAGCSARGRARWGASPLGGRSVTRSTRLSWRPLLWAAPASSEPAELTLTAPHRHLTSLLLLPKHRQGKECVCTRRLQLHSSKGSLKSPCGLCQPQAQAATLGTPSAGAAPASNPAMQPCLQPHSEPSNLQGRAKEEGPCPPPPALGCRVGVHPMHKLGACLGRLGQLLRSSIKRIA